MLISTPRIFRGVLTMAFAVVVGNAHAATASGNMIVSATVLDTCVLVVPPTMAFGNYSASVIDAQSDIAVTCTGTTAWDIAIDAGGSANIAARTMSEVGGDTLSYQLYTDASRSTVFGDGTTGSKVTGTGSGILQTVPIYGRLPASQYSDLGVYTDTVTVTLSY